METLAITGIALLAIIILLFQHVFNYMMRESDESVNVLGVFLTILSYAGMFGLFIWAIQIW